MEYITETLGQVLEREVARHPDREFMIYPDRDLRFTYAEFDRRVNRLAKGLLAIGLRKGDHLGIWATNVPTGSPSSLPRPRSGSSRSR